MVEDTSPDVGRDDRLVASVKDLYPELLLQLLDHRAQGRLGDVAVVGGFAEVAEAI